MRQFQQLTLIILLEDMIIDRSICSWRGPTACDAPPRAFGHPQLACRCKAKRHLEVAEVGTLLHLQNGTDSDGWKCDVGTHHGGYHSCHHLGLELMSVCIVSS